MEDLLLVAISGPHGSVHLITYLRFLDLEQWDLSSLLLNDLNIFPLGLSFGLGYYL